MRAVRCDDMTWLASTHVRWDWTVPPFAVLAGIIRAERIDPLDEGAVRWHVSSPLEDLSVADFLEALYDDAD